MNKITIVKQKRSTMFSRRLFACMVFFGAGLITGRPNPTNIGAVIFGIVVTLIILLGDYKFYVERVEKNAQFRNHSR